MSTILNVLHDLLRNIARDEKQEPESRIRAFHYESEVALKEIQKQYHYLKTALDGIAEILDLHP